MYVKCTPSKNHNINLRTVRSIYLVTQYRNRHWCNLTFSFHRHLLMPHTALSLPLCQHAHQACTHHMHTQTPSHQFFLIASSSSSCFHCSLSHAHMQSTATETSIFLPCQLYLFMPPLSSLSQTHTVQAPFLQSLSFFGTSSSTSPSLFPLCAHTF